MSLAHEFYRTCLQLTLRAKAGLVLERCGNEPERLRPKQVDEVAEPTEEEYAPL